MKPIYLEPDEEITSVIEKLSGISDRSVAVVVPKNSSLFQSLINLKLLAKEAQKQDKNIALISTNKVGQRLAAQVGLKTYNTLGGVGPMDEKPTAQIKTVAAEPAEEEVVDGVRVNRYRPAVGEENISTEPVGDDGLTKEEEANLPAIVAEPEEMPVVAEVKEEEIVSADKSTSPLPIVAAPAGKMAEKTEEKEPIEVKSEQEAMAEPGHMVSADDAEPPRNLPPVVSRGYVHKEREPFVMPWRSVIVAGILLLISTALIYVFLPKATATITFAAKSSNQTLTLTAQTSGDGQDLALAGSSISAQKQVSKTFAATGKKDIGTKATGTVTFYNNNSSSPVTIASGTTLTSGNSNFSLNSAITIPGATVSGGKAVPGQVSGGITAVTAGTDANVNNAQFTIKGQPALVYASGSTSGGVSKQVTVLAQSDVDAAINDLKTQANTQALADLQGKLNGQTLLDGSTWQIAPKQTLTNAVGDQVDNATATYIVEYDAITFSADTALTKIKANLSKDLTDQQQLVIQNPTTDVVYAYKSVSADKSSMSFTAAVQAYVINKVNQTAIAKAITNKSISQAKSIITSNYGAIDATVAISPGWWPKRLPLLSGAITIQYSFNQTQ